MRLPKFRCKNKIGNWCFFTVLHNGNVNEENFDLETLSQFTGLLDKQGVEIYEWDIVAYDLGIDEEKPENYKIIFDNKQCAYFMFPLNDKSRLRHFTYSAKNDCEVIGNIYEYENHGLLV